MIFLSLIVALGIIYWFGSLHFLHRDNWFHLLVARVQQIPGLASNPAASMALSIFIPFLFLAILVVLIVKVFGYEFLFVINVPILLYCVGRSDFVAEVQAYIDTAQRGDTVAAARWVDEMRGNADQDQQSSDVSDWRGLHTEALKVIAYRGFERTFAVLFWFVIAGALGALLYRLSVIYRDINESNSAQTQIASRWLWLLELPSVRLMGVTWAFVGNFDTTPLKESVLDMEKSSTEILNACLRGALGAKVESPIVQTETVTNPEAALNEAASGEAPLSEALLSEESADVIEDLTGAVIKTQNEPEYSFALVKSSMPLYTRSLLFWVCAIAFATLFIA
jgi:AmpE protein